VISAAVMSVDGLKDEESVKKVKDALMDLPGVLRTKVMLEKKIVTVDFDTALVDLQDLSRAIRQAGFLPV
jgi:copper chaperone CopZ